MTKDKGNTNNKALTELLTISEAARRIGASTTTMRMWERKGKLTPTVRVAGMRMYDPALVEKVAKAYAKGLDIATVQAA